MTTKLKILAAVALALATGATPAADPTTPKVQLKPGVDLRQHPAPALKNRIQLHPDALRVALGARITRATLSVYAVPFSAWCANPNRSTEGRVSVQMRFDRKADGTSVPAYLVVDTGAGEVRTRIGLGAESFSASSQVLRIPGTEICADRCVNVRLEPVNPPDADRINTAATRACIP